MHCASLGEFEQGRPVLEALKAKHPDCAIILSFFSPSGYEVRKSYAGADAVCYLPMDGPRNARRFLDIIRPDMVLFVKYEFWHYFLKELYMRQIPAMLVSGAFRESQPFFRWWGGFFRKILCRFSIITVQDAQSLHLLQHIGLENNVYLTGDTRYDRVVKIAAEARELPLIAAFKKEHKLIIAGSTWPEDERMLQAALKSIPAGWKLVVAPHEIHPSHLKRIRVLFGKACVFYSGLPEGIDANVLVIDNIGMLSALYRYGEIACIGGGYNTGGIHNVLEPAVFGLPVIMGPVYEKFGEAVQLAKNGFAFPAVDAASYADALRSLTADPAGLAAMQNLIRNYIKHQTGATAKILALLDSARWNP
jgi:3-deoxy-D-manno-octulosonic-acid transferase